MKEKVDRVDISRAEDMIIFRKQLDAMLYDVTVEILKILKEIDRAKFERAARYTLAIKRTIEWNPEKEFEPALYAIQRALRKVLGEGKARGV